MTTVPRTCFPRSPGVSGFYWKGTLARALPHALWSEIFTKMETFLAIERSEECFVLGKKKEQQQQQPLYRQGSHCSRTHLFPSCLWRPLSTTPTPPEPGEGIKSLQGTLELWGFLPVSQDELLGLCSGHLLKGFNRA